MAAVLLLALLAGCSPGRPENIDLYFVPQADFNRYDPNYVDGNDGFVWVYWNSAGEITGARILIASDRVDQEARSHLIWEELTQSLGLLNDSCAFADSIFYQEWSQVTGLSPMDRTLVTMLYAEEVRPNMDAGALSEALLGSFDQKEIDYLVEIALESEYGEAEPRVRKWVQDPVVAVHGSPTEADLQTLEQAAAELTPLLGGLTLRVGEAP